MTWNDWGDWSSAENIIGQGLYEGTRPITEAIVERRKILATNNINLSGQSIETLNGILDPILSGELVYQGQPVFDIQGYMISGATSARFWEPSGFIRGRTLEDIDASLTNLYKQFINTSVEYETEGISTWTLPSLTAVIGEKPSIDPGATNADLSIYRKWAHDVLNLCDTTAITFHDVNLPPEKDNVDFYTVEWKYQGGIADGSSNPLEYHINYPIAQAEAAEDFNENGLKQTNYYYDLNWSMLFVNDTYPKIYKTNVFSPSRWNWMSYARFAYGYATGIFGPGSITVWNGRQQSKFNIRSSPLNKCKWSRWVQPRIYDPIPADTKSVQYNRIFSGSEVGLKETENKLLQTDDENIERRLIQTDYWPDYRDSIPAPPLGFNYDPNRVNNWQYASSWEITRTYIIQTWDFEYKLS